MKIQEIVSKAEALLRKDQQLRKDPRYKKVIGFFLAKGLLIAPGVEPSSSKLISKDVIWVANTLEPRVWEVLPAALMHFPRSFIASHKFPSEIQIAVRAMKLRRPGPDVMGIPFKVIQRWAAISPLDRRAKALDHIKVMRTFRLTWDCITSLEEIAKTSQISQSQVIERLVEGKRGL